LVAAAPQRLSGAKLRHDNEMSKPDDAQRLQQAFSLHRSGQFAQAAALYRKIIKRNPAHAHALHSLGIIEAAAGNDAEAARLMARSLAVHATNLDFIRNYATVLCRLDRFEEAKAISLKGLAADGRNVDLLYIAAGAQFKLNELPQSLQTFDRLLAVDPAHVPALTERSSVLMALQQDDAAFAAIEQAVRRDPRYAEAYLNRAIWYGRRRRYDEALASFEQALGLAPKLAAAWLGRGDALFELRRFDEALEAYREAEASSADLASVWSARGKVFAALGRYQQAEAAFAQALARNPGLAEAWIGRGNALRELKLAREALSCFDKALALPGPIAAAWLGRGNALFELARFTDALAACDQAIASQPGFAEAWLGRGNCLLRLKRHDEALAAYSAAPALAECQLGRGNVFYELARYPEAAQAYDEATVLKPELAEAWNGHGDALRALQSWDAAVAAYDRALLIKPDLKGALSGRLNAMNCSCHWHGWDADSARLIEAVRSGRDHAAAFEFLAIPSTAQDQLGCARSWVKRRHPPGDQPLWQGERYAHDRIRLAYLSSDFRQHPVSYLSVGLFEQHDTSKFELTGISWARSDHSELRRRLEAAFERFIDVESADDAEVARRIREMEIDILVDLTGLTKYARTNILARRPAPLQVNYLGYPGTMGADYIDYLIADPVVIAPAQRPFYSEKIVQLPDSFMPHDAKSRVIANRVWQRAEFGLPATGFVFCGFNNAYKLNPPLFRSRMRLLQAVPGSVLWLTHDNAIAASNLRNEAAAIGIDPARLVFADRLPSSADHLARYQLADLFLDSLPYNAHSTASDALWAGLPVVTQQGETFAGRVAASLLTALGLPELIAQSEAGFERLAIELATTPEALAAIRDKLTRHRLTHPLFDTLSYTRHLERAYVTMVQRHRDGQPPDDIDIERGCATPPGF
jgi:predicted O-linked N-acetylglucosamine transferase (SPINDLY family)